MFIELTRTNNEKVTVNTSSIAYFLAGKEGANIYFANGGYLWCKESYESIRKILLGQNK
jgi:hypothetical protein